MNPGTFGGLLSMSNDLESLRLRALNSKRRRLDHENSDSANINTIITGQLCHGAEKEEGELSECEDNRPTPEPVQKPKSLLKRNRSNSAPSNIYTNPAPITQSISLINQFTEAIRFNDEALNNCLAKQHDLREQLRRQRTLFAELRGRRAALHKYLQEYKVRAEVGSLLPSDLLAAEPSSEAVKSYREPVSWLSVDEIVSFRSLKQNDVTMSCDLLLGKYAFRKAIVSNQLRFEIDPDWTFCWDELSSAKGCLNADRCPDQHWSQARLDDCSVIRSQVERMLAVLPLCLGQRFKAEMRAKWLSHPGITVAMEELLESITDYYYQLTVQHPRRINPSILWKEDVHNDCIEQEKVNFGTLVGLEAELHSSFSAEKLAQLYHHCRTEQLSCTLIDSILDRIFRRSGHEPSVHKLIARHFRCSRLFTVLPDYSPPNNILDVEYWNDFCLCIDNKSVKSVPSFLNVDFCIELVLLRARALYEAGGWRDALKYVNEAISFVRTNFEDLVLLTMYALQLKTDRTLYPNWYHAPPRQYIIDRHKFPLLQARDSSVTRIVRELLKLAPASCDKLYISWLQAHLL